MINKSKKGSIFFGIGLGITIYIFGILFLPFLMDDVTTFRTSMDCSNVLIGGGEMLSCLVGDLTIPYIIFFIISLALGFMIGGKK